MIQRDTNPWHGRDPLNHDPTLDYMAEVPYAVSDADFSTYRRDLQGLYNLDRAVYARDLKASDQPATTLLQAVEFNKKTGFGLKPYYITREFQYSEPLSPQEWYDASVGTTQDYPGFAIQRDFLAHDPEGQLMRPIMVGGDDAAPPRSRLKMYYASRSTSFRSVRAVMTMGGRRAVSETNLQDLRSLILAVLGLAADYPEEAEVAAVEAGAAGNDSGGRHKSHHQRPGYVYFFHIARGGTVPDVKFCLTTHVYGADDLTTARNLVAWLRLRGRGAYADAYLAALEKMASHRGLADGKGLHTHISYMWTAEGEPDITSYIAPEIYHIARYPNARRAKSGGSPMTFAQWLDLQREKAEKRMVEVN